MKNFTYTITDPEGIHARPAGLLVKAAGAFTSKITITKEDKIVDAKRIFGIMGLGVKKGQELTITIDGDDEIKAEQELKEIFEKNL